MHVVEWLEELGGVASRSTLVRLTSRTRVDRALRAGDVVADARGRYALPRADEAVRAAHRLTGVLSHESAALHHGWELKTLPATPHVTVPKNRKVSPAGGAVHLHRADLHPDDVSGIATSPGLTIDQCLRTMSFDAALAVADSALRHGVAAATLRQVASAARGPGSAQVRRVAREARMEAANPFESVLRAIVLDVPGLHVRPQQVISSRLGTVRPDLVDEDLRIVIEADSFEWHGKRAALRRDCRRYNLLVSDGWIVLRFAWEDVMHDQAHVRAVLVAVADLVLGRTEAPVTNSRVA